MLYRHDLRVSLTPSGPAGRLRLLSSSRAIHVAMLALCLVLLHACAGAPPPPEAVAKPELSPEQAFAQGNYAQAARLWQQQSAAASEPNASGLRVRAADAWMLADNIGQAQQNLQRMDASGLSGEDSARLQLVMADIALHNDQPNEAESLLRKAQTGLPKSLQQRFEQLNKRLQQALTRPGSQDVSHAVALISTSRSYLPKDGLQFLHALQNISSTELALHSTNPRGDQTTAGWLDLALVIRQNLVDADAVQQNVEAWKSRYPGHFLTADNALDLWLLYRQEFVAPQRVAVLLPMQGALQAAAEAIRDGIMSAFMDGPGSAELVFLDVGENGERTDSAYFEARDMGVDQIIGPLQKPAIEALLKLTGLATPVLALNDLPDNFSALPGLEGRIQSISLSQDQETRAVAREAIRSGYQNAIVFAPETEWGERMVQNFRDEFVQENRQIVASTTYLESENDHSPALEHLLEIDESKSRGLQVENALQMKIEFEPVRRDDADVLFLVANSSQGRSIRPQLLFLNAGDIPAYATGRIFTGKPDPAGDQDLNGIRFPITPQQLGLDSTRPAADLASLRAGAFSSLYALGLDAWNILPWLDMMKRDPDFRFSGASGTYRSGNAGELYREPAFALFIRGLPVPLDSTTHNADTGDNN
jgi:uncharacterized protein